MTTIATPDFPPKKLVQLFSSTALVWIPECLLSANLKTVWFVGSGVHSLCTSTEYGVGMYRGELLSCHKMHEPVSPDQFRGQINSWLSYLCRTVCNPLLQAALGGAGPSGHGADLLCLGGEHWALSEGGWGYYLRGVVIVNLSENLHPPSAEDLRPQVPAALHFSHGWKSWKCTDEKCFPCSSHHRNCKVFSFRKCQPIQKFYLFSELIDILETPELAGSDSEEEDDILDILEVSKVVTECKSLVQVRFKSDW